MSLCSLIYSDKQGINSANHLVSLMNIANPGGGVLPEKLVRGVQPASQNPYPIYDENKNLKPYL